jgi:predicted  nucleic acid-binding Zn-ribbon protein
MSIAEQLAELDAQIEPKEAALAAAHEAVAAAVAALNAAHQAVTDAKAELLPLQAAHKKLRMQQ